MEKKPAGMKRIPLDPNLPPSVQLKKAKQEINPRMVYLPHTGAKQRAKALKRVAKLNETKLEDSST